MTPPRWQTWTGLGLIYVVWGSTYLAIRYVLESLPPLLTAGCRFLTASALLGAFLLLRRRRTVRPSARQVACAVAIGLLLLLGGNGGVTLAENAHLPSGLAALLVAAVPLWVVLLRAAARDRPTRGTLVGVAVGFVGLAVLLLPGARPTGVTVGPVLLVLGSSVLWATGSVVAGRVDLPADPLVTTVVEMLGGAAGFWTLGLLRGESPHLHDVHVASVVAFAYLVLFGSIVAFTAFAWLLSTAPVSLVSTYAYVNPVVAVLLGAAFVGERISVTTLVGGAITVAAVALVITEESRRRPAGPQPAAAPPAEPVPDRPHRAR